MGRRSWVFALAAIASALFPVCVGAEPDPVPSGAQAAIDRGLADAQRQDFKGAADEFLAARSLAPDDAQIWFDLGLAQSNLPGYELRAIAWFKLYLLRTPDAPDAPAVRQQIAALETAFETRITAIADKLEAVLALRKARYGQSKQSPEATEALRSLAAQAGQDLASIRYALGAVSDARSGLVRSNGAGWRERWMEGWLANESVEAEEPLVSSIASAGLPDQALDMLQQIDDPSTVDFFVEQGAETRTQGLKSAPPHVGHAGWLSADACSPSELNPGVMSNCRVSGWWGPSREAFLLKIGLNGVELDTTYDETHLADYLAEQSLDATDVQYAFQIYPESAAYEIAKLALDYRRLRGLARVGRASP